MHLYALPLVTALLFLAKSGYLVHAESLRGDAKAALPTNSRADVSLSYMVSSPLTVGGFGTQAYELTGKNPENSTGPVITGVVTRFNETAFGQSTSAAKWIAVFDCDNTASTADLISNAARLGAQAIIAYSDASDYCVATGEAPPSPIPIYTLGGLTGSFGDALDGFPTLQLQYYDSAQFDAAAAVVDNDLRTKSLKSGALLGYITRNVTDHSTFTSTATSSGGPTAPTSAGTTSASSSQKTNSGPINRSY
ncbi:hypothetical protein Hypma_008753 [Hypsizygus marmoreus]|uniref:PA domain-containing protein n=1 Tax=Hypsizygus marmoreus TaxID=39966 RepID=A0A369JX74_HYPMA|nr:hypothetical protein Hypma_008753 [Hypsizygus marmoreus]